MTPEERLRKMRKTYGLFILDHGVKKCLNSAHSDSKTFKQFKDNQTQKKNGLSLLKKYKPKSRRV